MLILFRIFLMNVTMVLLKHQLNCTQTCPLEFIGDLFMNKNFFTNSSSLLPLNASLHVDDTTFSINKEVILIIYNNEIFLIKILMANSSIFMELFETNNPDNFYSLAIPSNSLNVSAHHFKILYQILDCGSSPLLTGLFYYMKFITLYYLRTNHFWCFMVK